MLAFECVHVCGNERTCFHVGYKSSAIKECVLLSNRITTLIVTVSSSRFNISTIFNSEVVEKKGEQLPWNKRFSGEKGVGERVFHWMEINRSGLSEQ